MPTFYRIVKTAPPTVRDFTSNRALGKPPRGPERDDPTIWSGLSMYGDEGTARAQARRIPRLGAFLARLDVPHDGPIRCRQTGSNPAHYTVWGEPDDLLSVVVAVLPVED